MISLSFLIARIKKNLSSLRLRREYEECPRCPWIYTEGQGICRFCVQKNKNVSKLIEDVERCENCGEIVPPEHHTIGIEYQGEPERSGSVYYLAGYNCPACGHHAEV
jgi:hypothetical protein